MPIARRISPALVAFLLVASAVAQSGSATRFEISFPASAHAEPITGRVFVFLSHAPQPEPRLTAGSWTDETPMFAADVDQLRPGQPATIDQSSLGFPLKSLKDLPPGDYYVQALINVYTEFHRADGHTIWAHMDQWEGQQFNLSPGNLYSEVQQVHINPAQGNVVRLELTKVIPPVEVPPDTPWVKRVKIQSPLLTKFWGRPIYFGATVLLPKGYAEHPQQRYPVIYMQGHFSLRAPFGFDTDDTAIPAATLARLRAAGRETGNEFARAWMSDNFPRMIAVTFQHPTVYFDDSYAVNSANQGPYGDAILTELIPYLETHFRIIRKPYARVLTGGSTGGWESLALQVLHPDFFGGTWTFCPDPIDFTRYQMVDIYEDPNAFVVPGVEYNPPERPMMRTAEGQVMVTMRQMSQMEEVLGTHGRSGQQFEEWEAAYGPVGNDGYPKPLWDKLGGKIDRDVALYMRDHGYDLTWYLEQNWARLAPQLQGKLHLYVGDMDNYYLNLAVYRLQDFLDSAKPAYRGSFEYGRPMKGHGWQPWPSSHLVRLMWEQVQKNAPKK